MGKRDCFYCGRCPCKHSGHCSCCDIANYCDEECQHKDWRYHEYICPILAGEDDGETYKVKLSDLKKYIESEEMAIDANMIAGRKKSGKSSKRNVKISRAKARKILKDGNVRGHPLTEKQKRFFGWIVGGGGK